MINILENVALADKTSYKIGGPARYYAEPECEEDVVRLYQYGICGAEGRRLREPVSANAAGGRGGGETLVLGNGSNVLISDKGVDGCVINLAARFKEIVWDGALAEVTGGFPLDDLAEEASRRGCVGMAELSGIPGTVGGAAVMNAGAFDACVAQTLRSVRVLRASSLTVETVSADDLALGYRSSALKGGGDVVLSAKFEFTAGNAAELMAARERILCRRREKQPLESPSCGSVFKRPAGKYAGTLIDSCGLKGFRTGGAMVSQKHANFIINTGCAKAEDVRAVIRHVQKNVYERFGILLEPEVIFIGEFETPLYAAE